MEKNDSLSGFELRRFIHEIVGTVRLTANTYAEMQQSKNGCIRITMVPLSGLADEWWLNGHEGEFDPHDVCEREQIFKLNPDGSHTMTYHCEDGHTEPVNCYGYSALKVAYASWERRFDAWVKKNEVPEDLASVEYRRQTQYMVAENGYSLDGGVVCATIRLNGEDFMRLYVTVSGFMKGEDDEVCALAGMKAAQEFLTRMSVDSGFVFSLDLITE